MTEELFDILDEQGRVIGQAPRSRCHGDPSLLHPVVHVFVLNRAGHVFLQRRALTKDVQPGRWDTSVGGHLQPGEAPEVGARRESAEELGFEPDTLTPAYEYIWRSPIESEWIHAFVTRHEGPFAAEPAEIDEGRFWTPSDIEANLGCKVFTPQFEQEYPRLRTWLHQHTIPP